MYREAVTDYELKTETGKRAAVKITLEINPATPPSTGGTFTFLGQAPAGSVFPGDELDWHIKGKTGAPKLKGKNLTITLTRISTTTSPGSSPSEDFDHSHTLGSSLTVGSWSSTDGPADDPMHPTIKGVGYSITLDGQPVTKAPASSGGYLVIDTSGPPTGGGGGTGSGNCPPPVLGKGRSRRHP